MGANQTRSNNIKDRKVHFGSEGTPSSPQLTQLDLTASLGNNHGGSVSDQMSFGVNEFENFPVVALYDFQATLECQISLRKGDHLNFLGFNENGEWAEVETWCNDAGEFYRRGWVPASYLIAYSCDQSSNTITPQETTKWKEIARDTSSNSLRGLEDEPWFHSNVSRTEAEGLLYSGINGSFLVRDSESQPGQLSITVRHDGRVYHYRISMSKDGLYYVTEFHKFSTIRQLVEHHSKQEDGLVCSLLYAAPKRSNSKLAIRQTHSSSSDNVIALSAAGGLGGPQWYNEVSGSISVVDGWEIDRSEVIMRHKLGGGQYGDVYEALWKRYNTVVAVKTLKADVHLKVRDFLEEAKIMKNLKHDNLVALLGVCTQEPPLYIVTEFLPKGNLLHFLHTHPKSELPPSLLLHMIVQVAAGSAYLEQQKFVHRDLAARNCLVGDNYLVKVGDFGLARYIEQGHSTYTAGVGGKLPIKWTAPEGLAYNRFSTSSDVWSLGIVMWEVATYGQTPYPNIELQDIYHVLEKGYRMPKPRGCPQKLYASMWRCWAWEPADRPTMTQIHTELKDMAENYDVDSEVAKELEKSHCHQFSINNNNHHNSELKRKVKNSGSPTHDVRGSPRMGRESMKTATQAHHSKPPPSSGSRRSGRKKSADLTAPPCSFANSPSDGGNINSLASGFLEKCHLEGQEQLDRDRACGRETPDESGVGESIVSNESPAVPGSLSNAPIEWGASKPHSKYPASRPQHRPSSSRSGGMPITSAAYRGGRKSSDAAHGNLSSRPPRRSMSTSNSPQIPHQQLFNSAANQRNIMAVSSSAAASPALQATAAIKAPSLRSKDFSVKTSSGGGVKPQPALAAPSPNSLSNSFCITQNPAANNDYYQYMAPNCTAVANSNNITTSVAPANTISSSNTSAFQPPRDSIYYSTPPTQISSANQNHYYLPPYSLSTNQQLDSNSAADNYYQVYNPSVMTALLSSQPTTHLLHIPPPNHKQMKLDEESLNQFGTVPASDRIGKYLQSLRCDSDIQHSQHGQSKAHAKQTSHGVLYAQNQAKTSIKKRRSHRTDTSGADCDNTSVDTDTEEASGRLADDEEDVDSCSEVSEPPSWNLHSNGLPTISNDACSLNQKLSGELPTNNQPLNILTQYLDSGVLCQKSSPQATGPLSFASTSNQTTEETIVESINDLILQCDFAISTYPKLASDLQLLANQIDDTCYAVSKFVQSSGRAHQEERRQVILGTCTILSNQVALMLKQMNNETALNQVNSFLDRMKLLLLQLKQNFPVSS